MKGWTPLGEEIELSYRQEIAVKTFLAENEAMDSLADLHRKGERMTVMTTIVRYINEYKKKGIQFPWE
jgi:hypothetical protein